MRTPGIWFDNHPFKNVVFCELVAQNDTVKLMLDTHGCLSCNSYATRRRE